MAVLPLLLAVIGLWLRFLVARECNTRCHRKAASLWWQTLLLYCRCRWKVKTERVKDVLELVSVLICLLARGPGREERRTRTGLCYTQQALLTPPSMCLCLSRVESNRDLKFRYTPAVSQDIENTSQCTLRKHSWRDIFSCFSTNCKNSFCKRQLIVSSRSWSDLMSDQNLLSFFFYLNHWKHRGHGIKAMQNYQEGKV